MPRMKIFMQVALVLVSLGWTTSPAAAQDIRLEMYVSGNDLYERCKTDRADPTYVGNYGFCRGYIYAVADFFATLAAEAGRPSCKRPGVTGAQLVDMVIKYLSDHPEQRDRPGNFAVIEVLPSVMATCPR